MTIKVAIDMLVALQIPALDICPYAIIIKEPKFILYESKLAARGKYYVYGLLGINAKEDYPEIDLYVTPCYWFYNCKEKTRMYDLAIIPSKIPNLDPVPGLVMNDFYVTNIPDIAIAIKRIIKNIKDHSLESQLEECRKINFALRVEIAKLKNSITNNALDALFF
jgi:hypothetical protein